MYKVERYINIIEYQHDIALAIETLQQEVLQAGDYRLERQALGIQQVQAKSNQEATKLTSIDEVRDKAGEIGTCSALDIYGVRDELHFACLAPLNDVESLAYFGTDRLTVNDVERINDSVDFWESMGRGEARYVVLFEGKGNKAQPVKYYIGGLAFG